MYSNFPSPIYENKIWNFIDFFTIVRSRKKRYTLFNFFSSFFLTFSTFSVSVNNTIMSYTSFVHFYGILFHRKKGSKVTGKIEGLYWSFYVHRDKLYHICDFYFASHSTNPTQFSLIILHAKSCLLHNKWNFFFLSFFIPNYFLCRWLLCYLISIWLVGDETEWLGRGFKLFSAYSFFFWIGKTLFISFPFLYVDRK